MARLSQTFETMLSGGDRVKLSEQGRARWGTDRWQGGEDGVGIVSTHHPDCDEDFPYNVRWDNNTSNNYREGDLVRISKSPINNGNNPISDDQD